MEQKQSREALSDETVGNLFAALGNHEAKAIVLGGMQLGETYGVTAIHHLYVDPQGADPAYTGRVTNQIQYAKHSYDKVGLVAKVRLSETLQYELTTLGDREGKALAGYLLELSLTHPDISLRHLFGMTKNAGHERRAAADRLHIYQALLETDDLETGVISQRTNIPYDTVAHNLHWLNDYGVLTYHTVDSKKIAETETRSPKLGGRRRSDVVLSDEQRELVATVLAIADGIKYGTPEFITEGKNLLAQILADEEKVKVLVRKAIAASPEANRLPREVRFAKISNFLGSVTTATTTEITEGLASEMSKYSVKSTLELMRKGGLAQSVRTQGEAHWTLKEQTQAT